MHIPCSSLEALAGGSYEPGARPDQCRIELKHWSVQKVQEATAFQSLFSQSLFSRVRAQSFPEPGGFSLMYRAPNERRESTVLHWCT